MNELDLSVDKIISRITFDGFGLAKYMYRPAVLVEIRLAGIGKQIPPKIEENTKCTFWTNTWNIEFLRYSFIPAHNRCGPVESKVSGYVVYRLETREVD